MDNTVFIVDDDASIRDALGLLLGLRGFCTAFFADGASFLKAFRPEWRGCFLIDIRMPGMDGLTLQRRIQDIGCDVPIIILTGHGDVGSAREAFRANAVDFLEKPLDETKLIEAIEEAFTRQDAGRKENGLRDQLASRLAELTPREREVMALVVSGKHNREIASELGISVRTVEVHKARIMSKLKVDSVAQLVRITLGLDGGS